MAKISFVAEVTYKQDKNSILFPFRAMPYIDSITSELSNWIMYCSVLG